MERHSRRILQQETWEYLERIMPPRPAQLSAFEDRARERDEVVSPEFGKLLQCLTLVSRAESILQIGIGSGYETWWLAQGARQAEILVIDEDEEALSRVAELLGKAGVLEALKPLAGEAIGVLPTLEGRFDLVYLKAGATHYRRYLDLVLPKVRVGGLIVVDNLLLGGAIAQSPEFDTGVDEETLRATRAFNGYFMVHPQLTSVILPMGQGVGLATKLKPLVTEMGGPF